MYDRAPRNLNFLTKEDFGPNLGPATYDADVNFKSCVVGGYAPFGSLKERETIFDVKETDTPSPASYNPKLISKSIKVNYT